MVCSKKYFLLGFLFEIFMVNHLSCAQNDIGRSQNDIEGFISVTDSSRVRVLLNCGPQNMEVQLIFNETLTSEFWEWIVVGVRNNPECRLQGNGQTRYIIEIPVMKDPCGTQMRQPGTFENEIRIGRNPFIILKGDELVTVRCVYGPPEVGTPNLPPFPAVTIEPPYFPNHFTEPPRGPTSYEEPRRARPGIIVLIVFLILLLALLFLLCGCLYFFFKRRKLRVERRKKLILAVPPGSELNKLGLAHLWWSGKSNLANDALLSHDYMVSSNSTREGDYAGDTPSTSSGSPGHPPGQVGSPGSGGHFNQVYIHDSRPVHLPRAHLDQPDGHRVASGQSLHAIPEERGNNKRVTTSTEETMHSETVTTVIQAENRKNEKQNLTTDSRQKMDLDSVELTANQQAVEGANGISVAANEDSGSISTLEGRRYDDAEPKSPPNAADGAAATVTADVHAVGVLRQKIVTEIDRRWTEEFIKVVEQNRGGGKRRLTNAEVARWRRLVETDHGLQELLLRSRTLEDFEAISRHPDYENLFPQDKWAIIVQSLAHVTFMRRLTQIIDTQQQHPGDKPLSRTSEDLLNDDHDPDAHGSVQKRRYIKKSESAVPKKLSAAELMENEKEKRIFTRESYYRVKEEVGSHSEDETHRHGPAAQNTEYTNDRATTEFTEGVPAVITKRTAGAGAYTPHPPPPSVTQVRGPQGPVIISPESSEQYVPTLHVYVGNVEERRVPVQVLRRHSAEENGNSMYGTSIYDNWQSNPEEL